MVVGFLSCPFFLSFFSVLSCGTDARHNHPAARAVWGRVAMRAAAASKRGASQGCLGLRPLQLALTTATSAASVSHQPPASAQPVRHSRASHGPPAATSPPTAPSVSLAFLFFLVAISIYPSARSFVGSSLMPSACPLVGVRFPSFIGSCPCSFSFACGSLCFVAGRR